MNRVKFGDVVQEIKINVDRTTDDHEFFIAGEHMDSNNIHISRRGRFSESDVGPAFIRLFRPGQVLYGSRRTYLRKVAVADFEGITSNTTFVLETKDSNRLLQELLPYIMLTDRFSEYAVNNSKGSTNPYILFKDLAAYEFDLPTIEEQRQLVVLLSACDRAKEAYKRLLKQTDEVVKSQFIEMFGRADSNSMEWPSCEIKDLYDVRSSKRIYAKELTTSGIPFLKVADVLERINTGKSHPMTYISEKKYRELEESGLVPRTGDILVTSRGTIGKCYILTDNDEFYFQDGMISWLKAKQSCRLLPEFIAALFEEEGFLKALDEATNKTTVTYISLDKLAALKVICPPEDKQRAYLDFITQSDKSKFVDLQATISEMFTCMIKSLSIYGGQSYAE